MFQDMPKPSSGGSGNMQFSYPDPIVIAAGQSVDIGFEPKYLIINLSGVYTEGYRIYLYDNGTWYRATSSVNSVFYSSESFGLDPDGEFSITSNGFKSNLIAGNIRYFAIG